MDEPRPANQVATQSFERGVLPSRRCCHQSADLLARELAVWPVNAEVVPSGCCSKRRLRLLHQRPIVGYAVDRFFGPRRADGIAPLQLHGADQFLHVPRVRLVLYTSMASPQHPIQDAQLVMIFLRISLAPFQSEFERLLHSSLVQVQVRLPSSSTENLSFWMHVMTVKNKNILCTINKSDVYEPADSDTCIVCSTVKNEDLSAQSQASTAERLPSSSQSVVTCTPVRTE